MQTEILFEVRNHVGLITLNRPAALVKGATLSLADCFRMELAMVHQACRENDFAEGVRALLIDKDNTPRWQPGRHEDVSEEMIERFFRAPWSEADHPLANLEWETDW